MSPTDATHAAGVVVDAVAVTVFDPRLFPAAPAEGRGAPLGAVVHVQAAHDGAALMGVDQHHHVRAAPAATVRFPVPARAASRWPCDVVARDFDHDASEWGPARPVAFDTGEGTRASDAELDGAWCAAGAADGERWVSVAPLWSDERHAFAPVAVFAATAAPPPGGGPDAQLDGDGATWSGQTRQRVPVPAAVVAVAALLALHYAALVGAAAWDRKADARADRGGGERRASPAAGRRQPPERARHAHLIGVSALIGVVALRRGSDG
eukprot:gene40011-64935_t